MLDEDFPAAAMGRHDFAVVPSAADLAQQQLHRQKQLHKQQQQQTTGIAADGPFAVQSMYPAPHQYPYQFPAEAEAEPAQPAQPAFNAGPSALRT